MLTIDKLDFKKSELIIAELLNKEFGYELIPFEIAQQPAPDLWQDKKHPRVACEIKSSSVTQQTLLNQTIQHCNSIIIERSFEIFILVVLRNLSDYEKSTLSQNIRHNTLKEVRILELKDVEIYLNRNIEIYDRYSESIETWHEAYTQISEILSEFYKENQSSPASEIYKKLENSDYYNFNSGRIFQYPENENIKGLDPIQIFASFNYSRIQQSKRVDNINHLFRAFSVFYRVSDKTKFEGCPTPIITNIIYNRKIDVQNEIWRVFNTIIKEELSGLSKDIFESTDNWYGIGIPAFTIFLFWTKSEIFVPLDQNTSTFVAGLRIVESNPNNYETYIELCSKLRDTSLGLFAADKNLIRNIVKEAYEFVPKGTSETLWDKSIMELMDVLKKDKQEISIEEFEQLNSHNFKIIGIKSLSDEKGNPQKHIKNLQENETYIFYNSYEIKDDDTIIYTLQSPENLYNVGDKKISISAIVGKNGSGKSTITELLYLIINKLSIDRGFDEENELKEEPVFATMYFKTNTFYKLTVGLDIQIWQYKFIENENKFVIDKLIVKSKNEIQRFDFGNLFYSIIINYSMYGLNSKHIGPWIDHLFHKNDGYQIPIVLNPKRKEGIIDVNEEEYLAKSRLLSNLLEPREEVIIHNKISELISDKIPLNIELKIDTEKQLKKRKKYFREQEALSELDKKIINEIIDLLPIGQMKATDCVEGIKEYIYCKLISIKDYPQFRNYKEIYKDNKFNAKEITKYLNAVIDDTSHATFKVKQAMNYLTFGMYNLGKSNDIITSIKEIYRVKGSGFQSSKSKTIRTIELIPPSFFKFNILFDQNSSASENSFNELSSGEKQQILSINTILYHLINLDSVSSSRELIKYRSANVIFDEVELYFHPDMQRTYIFKLLEKVRELELSHLNQINLTFVTHSPFILSDIPMSNILMLEVDKTTKKSKPYRNTEQTFGANVHDLLANKFFMENGFMGEFVKNKIVDVSEYLNDCFENPEKLTDKPKYTENEAREFIKLIGEPLIKDSLTDLFSYLYKNEL